ncbi:MAG: cbb3-type cytochrome c oxidase subunit I, partial [Desulfobacterales bacterium]
MTTSADQQAATYPTAIAFCMTSALWFAGATSFGMIAAGYLIAPDFLANIGWLHFGKARPIHVNLVLFGFVTPGFLAASFYFIPKLLRTELYSETLGIFTAILWNITLISAVLGIGAGYSQGREYAELPWTVDIMVVVLFVLVIINVVMTIRQRQESILYVSVWYTTAAVVLTASTYIIGNVIWKPDTGALLGIPDAILLWFYGHNVFGLLLTPMGLAVAYYVLPIATRSPLYSHTLSLIGFWSLIIVYTHIGTHHLLQVPVPTYLKVIAIVDSVAMVIPVMVVLINLWFTVRG